jgi:2'-5' RNA ligase
MPDRLFIAVDLPAGLRAELGGLRGEEPALGRALRWARPEGLHITLRFLGDVSPERRDELIAALRALPPPAPFELRCEGLGTFGSLARPRVLWAGVGGDLDAMRGLQAAVEGVCEALGWPREGRPYSPHVTLARSRQGAFEERAALERLLAAHRERPFGEWTVEGFTLLRSRMGSGGSVYEAVYTHGGRGRRDP